MKIAPEAQKDTELLMIVPIWFPTTFPISKQSPHSIAVQPPP